MIREGFLEEAGYGKMKIGGVDGSALTLFSTILLSATLSKKVNNIEAMKRKETG